MAPDLGDLDIFEERLVIHGVKVGGRRLTKALFMQLPMQETNEPGSVRAWINFHWNRCAATTRAGNPMNHRHFIWSDANGRVFRSEAYEPKPKTEISLHESLVKGIDSSDLLLGAFFLLDSTGELEKYCSKTEVGGELLYRFICESGSFYFYLEEPDQRLYKSLVGLAPHKERMTSEEIRGTLEGEHITSTLDYTRKGQTARVERALAQLEKWPDKETVMATLKLQDDVVSEERAVVSGLWDVITTEVPQVFL